MPKMFDSYARSSLHQRVFTAEDFYTRPLLHETVFAPETVELHHKGFRTGTSLLETCPPVNLRFCAVFVQ